MAPHLLSIQDLTSQQIERLLVRGRELADGAAASPLAGKTMALLFDKPSLRTKVSFQVGIQQLGGYSVYMGPEEVGLGKREAVSDVARVLSRYVDCIVARVFGHGDLEELAQHSHVPVINALSDWEHPCQTLADLMTIRDSKGRLNGIKAAYIGDGNNVARSLCLGAVAMGMNFSIASPDGYGLDGRTLDAARRASDTTGAELRTVTLPSDAAAGADVVYTDVWASMGQEAEAQRRQAAFEGYTVDSHLMSQAAEGAIFMHDMPAHYGEEVAPGMLEHPQSVAYTQAENRLHAQKALLEYIMGGAYLHSTPGAP